jgi:hypothetical protein
MKKKMLTELRNKLERKKMKAQKWKASSRNKMPPSQYSGKKRFTLPGVAKT